MSRSDATRKLNELKGDGYGDEALMNVYKCRHCGRHHVGHKRLVGDTTPPRRVNL